ncbi:MAG: thymidine phosphorylase, partial [Planktotalea sp.]
VIREVTAKQDGIITAIDGEALGLAVVALGGGRQVESDLIDPAVGLSDVARLGAKISKGQPLARVHAAREGQADRAAQTIRAAMTIGQSAPAKRDLVHEVIT